MNAIIVGSGRTGMALARTLASTGHAVNVIDLDSSNASALRELTASGAPEADVDVIEGDGTKNSTLELARIRDADLFVAVTGDDNTNALAALKAKLTHRVMTVLATIWSGDLSTVLESLDVACVNPARLSADSLITNIPQVLQEQRPAPAGD